jgi:hypothetical protein
VGSANIGAGQRFVGLDIMRLVAGLSVSGRVSVLGSAQPASILTRVAVRLNRAADGQPLFDLPPARTGADGTFTCVDVPPGRYSVSAVVTGASSPEDRGWHVARITADGHDALDSPIELQPGDRLTDLSVEFTNRSTELTGTLFDASGRASSDYYVAVFPVDQRRWTPGSRWLRPPTRPASDGMFRLLNLPAGEYFMAAVTDYDPRGWWAPGFLQTLARSAIRVTLVEGQKQTQSMRVGG